MVDLKITLQMDADWSSRQPHHVSVFENGKRTRLYMLATPEEAMRCYKSLCRRLEYAHRLGTFLRFAKDALAFVLIATLVFLVWKVLG